MKYNINNIDVNQGFLFFWGHQPSKDGTITKSCFSQWWPASFTVEGVVYKTAEHWMMAKKAVLFNDEGTLKEIIAAADPKEVKALGRKVKNFNADIWKQHAYTFVVQGNFHKFSQHENLKAFLLSTNNNIIVEASPFDNIWGIGTKAHETNINLWKGTNLLGFALMEVRDMF
jgi:ribA/ribD-fused uncharacterized protein